jgi:cytochrome c oxidase subunit 2
MIRTIVIAGSALALAAPAFAATPIAGNPKKGKVVFVNTNCGACHTLKAAAALGNIGPNLDKAAARLTMATLVEAVTNGGATVMTKAQVAKYSTRMVAYKDVLTPTQIRDVAAFVYASTHH